MEAVLALEDGLIFEGKSIGARGETSGEIVFNTSLTGYQEILTDPSYAGQIVVLTYPLIGNYGVNAVDEESHRPFAEGLVVREATDSGDHWRQDGSLPIWRSTASWPSPRSIPGPWCVTSGNRGPCAPS